MKKMLMLATTAAMIEQFNKNNILLLEQMGYEVHVAGNFKEGNPISIEKLERFKGWLLEHNAKWFDIESTRRPLDVNNIHACNKVIKLIQANRYDFIHCHTPIGSVIGRYAAHKTHTPIIYTAHGFHFFKGSPKKNWLLYYPIEKFLSRWTDTLILINREDYLCATSKFFAKKNWYIPGVGIDCSKYKSRIDLDIERNRILSELDIPSESRIILSVGELNKNKNQSIIIEALNKLGNSDVHYILLGKGDYESKLRELVHIYGLEKNVHILGYRDDVILFYHIADIFVFPSKREGLSVALMEAMACGLPVICNNIRGNKDLIQHFKGGFLLEKCTSKEYCSAINELLYNENLRKEMSEYNKTTIENYDIKKINVMMKAIYEEFK